MASVRRRGKHFETNFQIDGVRKWATLHTTDKAEAQRMADDMEARHREGVERSKGLKRDMNKFLVSRRQEGRYSDVSMRNRASVLRCFGEDMYWSHTHLITSGAIQRWYDDQRRRVSESSALTYLLTVRAFFEWCVRQGIVASNPVRRVTPARIVIRTKDRFCTPAERDFLIAGAPTAELRFILYCGFHAGLRRNEIVEARPEWFDLKAGLLHLTATPTFTPKTRKPRTIPLSRPFREFLENDYGLPSPFMLRPKVTQGSAIYRYDFRRPFTQYVTSVGMAWVQPHLMRRTFASILASRDVSMHKIAVWLGDSVLTAERHYARLIPKDSTIDKML